VLTPEFPLGLPPYSLRDFVFSASEIFVDRSGGSLQRPFPRPRPNFSSSQTEIQNFNPLVEVSGFCGKAFPQSYYSLPSYMVFSFYLFWMTVFSLFQSPEMVSKLSPSRRISNSSGLFPSSQPPLTSIQVALPQSRFLGGNIRGSLSSWRELFFLLFTDKDIFHLGEPFLHLLSGPGSSYPSFPGSGKDPPANSLELLLYAGRFSAVTLATLPSFSSRYHNGEKFFPPGRRSLDLPPPPGVFEALFFFFSLRSSIPLFSFFFWTL